MKSLISLAGGGSLVNLWRRIPAIVKVPVIFGAGVLAAAELNIDANHAWFSNRIFGGQAAQGEAQMVDPADTRKAVAEGKHVSGAERMIEVQVSAGDADARTKTVYANAALAETALPCPTANCGASGAAGSVRFRAGVILTFLRVLRFVGNGTFFTASKCLGLRFQPFRVQCQPSFLSPPPFIEKP